MIGTTGRFRSWIPHGFDYLSPDETEQLHRIVHTIADTFHAEGYREIIPPMLDFSATFRLTARNPGERPLFETRDSDGESLSIRSDLTVQVIKAVANGRIHPPGEMRLSYFQPVFEDRPHGSGREREVFQGGVEWIGATSENRIEEIITLARRALSACGFEPRILYGDVRFLNALFASIPDPLREQFSNAFFYKDTSRIRELCSTASIDPQLARLLIEIPLVFGGAEAIAKLEELCRDRDDLMSLLETAKKLDDVIFDFSLVRELSYYTGPVFEAYIPQSKKPVLTGGVYDTLFEFFSSESKPACGFALNLSILLNHISGV